MEQDDFGAWLRETCYLRLGARYVSVKSADLWLKWELYCSHNGLGRKRRHFAERLREQGLEPYHQLMETSPAISSRSMNRRLPARTAVSMSSLSARWQTVPSDTLA